MGAYPWGFAASRRTRATTSPTPARSRGGALRSPTTARCRAPAHDYAALVASDRDAASAATTGARLLGRRSPARTARRPTARRLPSACDDGPFGNGTGGELRYHVTVRPAARDACGSPSPAPTRGAAPRERARGALRDPDRALAEKIAGRAPGSRECSQVDAAGRPAAAGGDRLGQAEPRRPDADAPTDLQIRWTNQGKQFPAPLGTVAARHAGSAPASRTTRGSSPPTASTRPSPRSRSASSRPPRPTCARCATSRTPQRPLGHRRARGRHRRLGLVRPGLGNRRRGERRLQHRRDGQVPERRRADLALDRRRPLPRRRCTTSRCATCTTSSTTLDADHDGWPEGSATSSAPGMGPEKLDNAVYFIRGLYDLADMAAAKRDRATERVGARARPTSCARGSTRTWWDAADRQYADSLVDPSSTQSIRSTGSASDADGGRAQQRRRGDAGPRAARRTARPRWPSARRPCYSGDARRCNPACSTPAAAAGPTARASSTSSRSTTVDPGRRRGQLRPPRPGQQQRYTDANAETMFSEPATSGTPDEQPGAMPEIFPSPGPRQREHQPLLDLPLDGHAGLGQLRHRVAGRSTSSSACGPSSATAGSRSCRRCRRPAERRGPRHPARRRLGRRARRARRRRR